MSEGTRSVLFGCHSPIHAFYVIVAWKELYGKYPKPWELICILLHDLGHLGLNYLSDPEQKKKHWVLGAGIAGALFGQKGMDLVAGHTIHSGFPISRLKKPDKFSHIIASERWMAWYYWIEGLEGFPPKEWKRRIRAEIEQENWRDCHEVYLDREEGK
jgi:hypothetical protein